MEVCIHCGKPNKKICDACAQKVKKQQLVFLAPLKKDEAAAITEACKPAAVAGKSTNTATPTVEPMVVTVDEQKTTETPSHGGQSSSKTPADNSLNTAMWIVGGISLAVLVGIALALIFASWRVGQWFVGVPLSVLAVALFWRFGDECYYDTDFIVCDTVLSALSVVNFALVLVFEVGYSAIFYSLAVGFAVASCIIARFAYGESEYKCGHWALLCAGINIGWCFYSLASVQWFISIPCGVVAIALFCMLASKARRSKTFNAIDAALWALSAVNAGIMLWLKAKYALIFSVTAVSLAVSSLPVVLKAYSERKRPQAYWALGCATVNVCIACTDWDINRWVISVVGGVVAVAVLWLIAHEAVYDSEFTVIDTVLSVATIVNILLPLWLGSLYQPIDSALAIALAVSSLAVMFYAFKESETPHGFWAIGCVILNICAFFLDWSILQWLVGIIIGVSAVGVLGYYSLDSSHSEEFTLIDVALYCATGINFLLLLGLGTGYGIVFLVLAIAFAISSLIATYFAFDNVEEVQGCFALLCAAVNVGLIFRSHIITFIKWAYTSVFGDSSIDWSANATATQWVVGAIIGIALIVWIWVWAEDSTYRREFKAIDIVLGCASGVNLLALIFVGAWYDNVSLALAISLAVSSFITMYYAFDESEGTQGVWAFVLALFNIGLSLRKVIGPLLGWLGGLYGSAQDALSADLAMNWSISDSAIQWTIGVIVGLIAIITFSYCASEASYSDEFFPQDVALTILTVLNLGLLCGIGVWYGNVFYISAAALTISSAIVAWNAFDEDESIPAVWAVLCVVANAGLLFV